MYYLEIQGLFKALNKFKGFSMLYKPCFPSPSLSSHASPFFTHLHFSLHSLLVPLPCPFLFPVLIYLPSPLPLLPFSCVSSCICLSFPFNISPCFFHLSLFYPLHSLCSFFLLLHWILSLFKSLLYHLFLFLATFLSTVFLSFFLPFPFPSFSFPHFPLLHLFLHLLCLPLHLTFSLFLIPPPTVHPLLLLPSPSSSCFHSPILFPPILSSCYIPPSSSGPKINFSINAPIPKLTKKFGRQTLFPSKTFIR